MIENFVIDMIKQKSVCRIFFERAMERISQGSVFQCFAAGKRHDSSPYLVVFTLGIEKLNFLRGSYAVLISVITLLKLDKQINTWLL